MATTPQHRAPDDYIFVTVGKDVYQGKELIAAARSHNTAKRIAFALNLYNKQYSLNRKRKAESK